VAISLPPGSPCPIGLVEPGLEGYVPLHSARDLDEADDIVVRLGHRRPTRSERFAAVVGALFGWEVPGADPARAPFPDAVAA
jgi:hypothetical protein